MWLQTLGQEPSETAHNKSTQWSANQLPTLWSEFYSEREYDQSHEKFAREPACEDRRWKYCSSFQQKIHKDKTIKAFNIYQNSLFYLQRLNMAYYDVRREACVPFVSLLSLAEWMYNCNVTRNLTRERIWNYFLWKAFLCITFIMISGRIILNERNLIFWYGSVSLFLVIIALSRSGGRMPN